MGHGCTGGASVRWMLATQSSTNPPRSVAPSRTVPSNRNPALWATRADAELPAYACHRTRSSPRPNGAADSPKSSTAGTDSESRPFRREAGPIQYPMVGSSPTIPSRADVIAAIAHDLQRHLSDVATVDLVYEAGDVADLTVEPANQTAWPISVVGIGAGFAIFLKTGTWEIDNSTEGPERLNALISDTAEGRIA